jgi:hypothetical protein
VRGVGQSRFVATHLKKWEIPRAFSVYFALPVRPCAGSAGAMRSRIAFNRNGSAVDQPASFAGFFSGALV